LDEIKAGHLDEEQKNLWYARMGYYFGEALRHSKPSLACGLGNPEFAFANHPVVSGFADQEEAEVITISNNLIDSVAEGLSPLARIENGVNFWFDMPVDF
jgi:hypothetical protein